MRGRTLFVCFLPAWLMCGAGSLARAQEARATLAGRVTDAQGALVPGAIVSVVSDDTGVRRQTETNPQGNWVVQFLLPGRYQFTVTAQGFKTANRTGITLQTGDYKQIDIQIDVGVLSQAVEVSGETPLIDTTSSTAGAVISSAYMTEMPTLSHVPTLLATLAPGVMAQDQNNNVVRPWSFLGASRFSAEGGRSIYSNNFQLDGLPNTRIGGYVAFIAPIESLQEFRVQTNAYDASISRQAGSTINMQTKSGTKDYHGSLYWFNQNNILNAKLFQANLVNAAKPPVHFNKGGAAFGGPLWIPKVYNGKEKTFFFVSYDLTRTIDPRPGNTRSVPTDLERGGDFSASFTTQAGQRFPILIYDPLSVDARGNRTLFAGSRIPGPRLSPIAQNILKYVPLPNAPGDPTSNASNNFVANSVSDNTIPMVSARIDHVWNDAHRSFGVARWSYLTQSFDNYFQNAATGQIGERISKSAGFDHVWSITPTKVLDLRYAVSRYEWPYHDTGAGFDPVSLGFSPSYVSQLVYPSFPRITGFAGNFGSLQGGAYENNTYHTWSASLMHIQGSHSLRYGGEYWVLQEAYGDIGVQPLFGFNSNWTRQSALVAGGTGVGSPFGSFLLGLPSGGDAPVNANGMYSQRFTGFYFQDDWRVTPKLTVNLGLRWDFQTPVTERFDRLTSQYDMSQLNPVSPSAQAAYSAILSNPANAGNAGVQVLKQLLPATAFRVPGAVLFAGVNGQQRGYSNPDYFEWQPRFGAAYQIGPNTVVRGGLGRFTQASFDRGGQNGFSRTTSLVATQDNYFTPYDTLADPFRGGILQPTGSSLGAMTNLGAPVDFNDPNPGRMYTWNYSFYLQHQIKSWLLEAGYTHTGTYDVPQGRQQGNPPSEVWNTLNGPQFDKSGRPLDPLLWSTLVPNPFFQLPGVTGGTIGSSKTVPLNQLLYANPLLGPLSKNGIPLGKTGYDSLQAKVERRFSGGLGIINSFTWSKLLEDTSLLGPQIAGINVEHKLGDEDRTFVLSIAPIWEIPVGRGKRFGGSVSRLMDAFVGGWQLTGQYIVQSGRPIVFDTSSFFSGNDFAIASGERSLDRWFDTSQFMPFPTKNTDVSKYPAWTGIQNVPGYDYAPAPSDNVKNGVYQSFGTYVRDYPTRWGGARGSRVNELNLALFKNLYLTERVKLQLRFEAFNALNHPRFGHPDTNPGSANFGRVAPSQQNQARAIQMGARLTF